jgi:hypothetical protein
MLAMQSSAGAEVERDVPDNSSQHSSTPREAFSLLLRAGALTAITDGLFSSGLSVFAYDSTITRLFQGVAAVLLGDRAFGGGATTAALGVAMHVGVAFGWSAVFQLVLLRSRRIRDLSSSPYGVVKVASLYGPFVWLVMSLLVIPVFAHQAPKIGFRWWVQLIGHIPFVGVPIVANSVRRRDSR